MFHVIVYMCTIVFCCLFEDHLQVLDFPVDNGGNNVPVAEELYCIFNILTINVYLIMYVTYFTQCTCDVMVHIQSMVGLLMQACAEVTVVSVAISCGRVSVPKASFRWYRIML